MKKFNLSLVTVLAMSTFAVAGGDIAPVEPVVETPVMEEPMGAFYLGLGYSLLNVDGTATVDYGEGVDTLVFDEDFDEIMFQAGYKFNDYVAVEGRYWFGLDETISDLDGSFDLNIDAWGIYVKPMYPVTNEIDVYALIGYASVEADGNPDGFDSVDGFSWGIGAAYSISDNVSVFVDYVSLYDDTENYIFENLPVSEDVAVDTWNFGVTYKF